MNPKKMLIGLALLSLFVVPEMVMAATYWKTFSVTSSIPSAFIMSTTPTSIKTTFTERGTGGPSIKINHNFGGSDHVSGSMTEGQETTTYYPNAPTYVYVRRDINDCTGSVTVTYFTS